MVVPPRHRKQSGSQASSLMPRTEERLSLTDEELIIEKMLDVLEVSRKKTDSVTIKKSGCAHTYQIRNDEYHLLCMNCGLVVSPCIRHVPSTMDAAQWKNRKMPSNKYKPETYAKDLINAMLGAVLPVQDAKYSSLLQMSQVPHVLNMLKEVLPKNCGLMPDDICNGLKKLKLGRLYKYRMFLCSCLNPEFEPEYLDWNERDLLMKQFRGFARRWGTRKKEYCERFNIKRKSLPHVPSVIHWLIVNVLKKPRAAAYIRRMRSPVRQTAIDKIIEYVFTH